MSFYDNDNTWQNRQWETAPSRSGASSVATQQSQMEPNAFAAQFEEIERATDNLLRSGKYFGIPNSRRGDLNSPRHTAGGEFDRPGSSLQGFYQGQRSRQSEAEQVLHAKRRMAAQRERELRNYHQEQQYNRSEQIHGNDGVTASTAKSDRSMSPNTMSEEDRRDLIARQHRALYGDSSSLYNADGTSRSKSKDVRMPSGGRGSSPLALDQQNSTTENISLSDAQRTTSPTTTPSTQGVIGTRPSQGNTPTGFNKRATTPSISYNKDDRSTSSLSYNKDDRSTSSNLGDKSWNNGSNGWGKNTLNSQASVWG